MAPTRRPSREPGRCTSRPTPDRARAERSHRLVVVGNKELAAGHLEGAAELIHSILERGDVVIGQVLGLPDRREQPAIGPPEEVEKLSLEPLDVADGHVIDLAGGACPDRDDLLLNRIRRVLRLLEQLDKALTAIEL
jgi:hypothetical protein